MGKMTQEKKKRREKRLTSQKQAEPLFNSIGKLVSVMKDRDPEFKMAADAFKLISDKYPKLEDAPQDELKAAMGSIMNKTEQMASFLASSIQNKFKNLDET